MYASLQTNNSDTFAKNIQANALTDLSRLKLHWRKETTNHSPHGPHPHVQNVLLNIQYAITHMAQLTVLTSISSLLSAINLSASFRLRTSTITPLSLTTTPPLNISFSVTKRLLKNNLYCPVIAAEPHTTTLNEILCSTTRIL